MAAQRGAKKTGRVASATCEEGRDKIDETFAQFDQLFMMPSSVCIDYATRSWERSV